VRDLIKRIQNTPDCRVFPPKGIPKIPDHLSLPLDVQSFYSLAGGAVLLQNSLSPYEIPEPQNFVPSNEIIFPEGYDWDLPENDRSYDWYVAANSGPEQYISIDLNPDRLGRCYDSFWQLHATEDAEIVALSFREMIEHLLDHRGDGPYWVEDGFPRLGFAYD